MKGNQRAKQDFGRDTAVSPVIGVILMVAITVVLAATVYVWVSGLAQTDGGNEDAALRVTMGDKDGDGSADYIKILLVKGEHAPYNDAVGGDPNEVTIQVSGGGGTLTDANSQICTGIPAGPFDGATFCRAGETFGADSTTWAVGQTLFVQCTDGNPHSVSVAVRGTAVHEAEVKCDELTPA